MGVSITDEKVNFGDLDVLQKSEDKSADPNGCRTKKGKRKKKVLNAIKNDTKTVGVFRTDTTWKILKIWVKKKK